MSRSTAAFYRGKHALPEALAECPQVVRLLHGHKDQRLTASQRPPDLRRLKSVQRGEWNAPTLSRNNARGRRQDPSPLLNDRVRADIELGLKPAERLTPERE